jgi:hypothetical protein
VDIINERGFLRVELVDGKDVTREPRPKRPYHYRIQYDATTPQELVDATAAALQAEHGFPARTVEMVGETLTKAAPDKKSSSIAEAQAEAASFEAHEAIIRDILGKDCPHLERAGPKFGS